MSGMLRGLAVTGRERSPVFPTLPTMAESGYVGFEDLLIWQGLMAPAGIPEPIARKLEAEMIRIARMPDVKQRISEFSATVVGSTSQELREFIQREIPAWKGIITSGNIQIN